MYKYNYIIFYLPDSRFPKPVPDGYQRLSLNDLEGLEDVHLIPYPLHHLPYIFRLLFFLVTHHRLNKIIPHFVESLFYPHLFDKKYVSNKPICFILISGGNVRVGYLDYLKNKYPNCKIIWFFRDLVSVGEQLYPESVHNKNIDIEMTFDNGEARKYGIKFCPEYSSLVDLSDHINYPYCDVFFCGKAKDRYETLISYYRYLTEKGLKCHFFITQVPQEDQVMGEGLFYNHFMPYKEMLCRSANSKCLLDINQKKAYGGYTSRFYEAIMYNRKLISDNPITIESPFYNEKDMIFVTKPDEITDDFINDFDSPVDFHYNGEFSPLRMIETVEKLLQN